MKKFFVYLWNVELPGWLFAFALLLSLYAFENFNYSTTQYALFDMLGNLKFAGTYWATILAVAFCLIDLAGASRTITPSWERTVSVGIVFLFCGWFLAAIFNSMLICWAIFLVTYSNTVSIGVGVMSFIIRLLIIGTFVLAKDGIFSIQPTSISSKFKAVIHATKK